jgi:hypothetical protein
MSAVSVYCRLYSMSIHILQTAVIRATSPLQVLGPSLKTTAVSVVRATQPHCVEERDVFLTTHGMVLL